MSSIRHRLGALVHDWPRFLRHIGADWTRIRNRREATTSDGRGVRCDWVFGSDLHLAKVYPTAGRALMRRALRQWPVLLEDFPAVVSKEPAVSFVIGHRGLERLPNLLITLKSIAGQSGEPIECIVVEQSERPEVRESLPSWVHYLHTPVPHGFDYCRSATFNAGAQIARGEVLIAHDNDMLAPHRYATEVIQRAREGWDFIDLKRFVFYLTEEMSRALFAGAPLRAETIREIAQNLKGGSIAATRDGYAAAGGYDEGFVGWGGEDLEFWERARVAGRVYEFGYLPLLHLWHPPQPGRLDHSTAPAMQRYEELSRIPPGERIARLRSQSSK